MTTNKGKNVAAILKQLETRDTLYAPYERALGRLSMRFELLHSLLEWFGWDIWGMDRRVASILTKDLPIKHLVEKLRETIKLVHLAEEDGREYKSILDRVELAATKRNQFLHSLWFIGEGQPTWCFNRKRGKLVGPDVPSSKAINDLSNEIVNIVDEFMAIRDRVRPSPFFGIHLGAGKSGES